MITPIWNKIKIPTIAILLIISIVILATRKSCNQVQTVNDPTDTLLPVKTKEDSNGKLVAIIKSQQDLISKKKKLIDSLSGVLKIKSSQIRSVDRYLQKIDTVIVHDVIYQQSDDSVIISKKDGYLNLKAVGKREGSAYISLQHVDTLWRIERKNKPIFKPSYTEVYLRSASPYNKINQGSSFVVKSPRPIIGIGPSLGFDPIGRKITFQIGVQYNMINIYGKK